MKLALESWDSSRLSWEELFPVSPWCPPQQCHPSCTDWDGFVCRALPTGAPDEGLLLAQAGSVFARLLFLSNA